VDNDDSLLEEVDRDLMQTHEDDYRLRSQIRDIIANEMWIGYCNN